MSTNIIGIGMDATEIDRIEATIARYGDRFLRRIFTEGEIAYATRRRNPAPASRRPVRGQGSGDEGARHGSFAGRAVARYRGRARTAGRRNCGFTAAPPAGSRS